MRLTQNLAYYVKMMPTRGSYLKGTHQFVPRITASQKAETARRMVQEQKNLDLLDTPWLTQAEDTCYNEYVTSLKLDEKAAIQKAIDKRKRMMPAHTRWNQHLDHLNVTRAWE